MTSFYPLSEKSLRDALADSSAEDDFFFHVYTHIDSTNQFLKDAPKREQISVCIAETQSQGRGRFERHWASPYGENLYLSSRWKLKRPLTHPISSLSLVVGLALIESLKPYTKDLPISVKWPNDLFFEQRKLAGILIEILSDTERYFEVVIGIGLNVNTDTHKSPLASTPCCSLYDITGQRYDRNQLIANILITLKSYINRFQQAGFRAFEDAWREVDYLRGKYIQVSHMQKLNAGVANGVTGEGELRLIDEQGIEWYLSSGEASIMVMKG